MVEEHEVVSVHGAMIPRTGEIDPTTHSAPCLPAVPDLIDMMRSYLPWSTDRNFSFGLNFGDLLETGNGKKTPCGFLLLVHGMSFDRVAERPELLEAVGRAVREAVAADAGVGVPPETVELMGGPGVVQAAIVLPSEGANQLVQRMGGPQVRLAALAPKLCRTVAAALEAVPGVEAALTDVGLTVTELGNVLVAPDIVRFQGFWSKDQGPGQYTIRGAVVNFPSGGRADLSAVGPYTFGIAHPSGAIFEAELESNGQQLRWTNGSVWTRCEDQEGAPRAQKPEDAAGAAEAEEQLRPDTATKVGPLRWGVTAAQCKALLRSIREDPAWKPNSTVETLVTDFLIPRTKGTKAGYALSVNAGGPREANVLLVHARGRAGNAEELLEAAILGSKSRKDAFWIDALALLHDEGAALSNDHARAAEVLEHLGAKASSGCRRCRLVSAGLLRMLPAALSALALVLFYEPMLVWGCVPDKDLSRCAVRSPAAEGDWSMGAEWAWSARYEQELAGAPDLLDMAYRWLYPTALCSAVLAFLSWALALAFPQLLLGGRVLVVMGPQDTATTLGEQAAAAVVDARRLGVPVSIAGGVDGAAAAARKADYVVKLAPPGEGVDLGIEVVEEGRRLFVSAVTGGLVEEWNKANPDTQVRVQDRLLKANGVVDPKSIHAECAKRKAVTLTFRQAPTCRSGHPLLPLEAPTRGICDGCGRTVDPGVQVIDCGECDFFLCEACAPQAACHAKPKASAAGRAEGPLRAVARWRLASEAFAALRWAAALWLLRTADAALALSGGSASWSLETTAPFCALGALVGVALTAAAAECAARSGARATAGCALLVLAAGGAAIGALAFVGALRAEPPAVGRWKAGLEWLGDEALRHVDLAVCNTPMRQRAAAFAATCGQTLVIGGVNLALFAAGALCCPRAVRARPWAGCLLVGILLLAATAARFAGLALAAGDFELPETEFWFPAAVFGLTQTAARCGAPQLALLAAASRRGVAKRLQLRA